ncbi:MAG: DUF6384 family protein [Gammaproteobacteria bacterium]|jgi:hypothetical protein
MSQNPLPGKAPLDELMLAMDVVDTLRHRELIVQRELLADERDRDLIDRLRDIYAGQGIDVSDAVLERGVRDLRENRFVYTPPPSSIRRTLAHIYVSRGRWAPAIGFVVAIVAAALLGYQLLVRGPQLAEIAALPDELGNAFSSVVTLAQDARVDLQAESLNMDAEQALAREDFAAVRAAIAELEGLHSRLQQQYELRVVSRPGQLSGVWRIPDDNPDAQNFYLIVEAIDAQGNRLTLPVENEENGRVERVSRWGQRVEEAKFRQTADDKQDDGIIQNNVIGTKRRGVLEQALVPGVLTGAITDW